MPDPTVTTDKKPRRRKAKRPAADPATPRKPRTTLLSRIEAMGPTHLAAYRTLCDGTGAFANALAAAFKAQDEITRAALRRDAAKQAFANAQAAFESVAYDETAGRAVLAKLDRVARTIAQERGDVPTDDATAPTVAPTSGAD